MQPPIINTSRGPKTPGEARMLFVGGACNNGDLLGIISGLAQVKGPEATEVALYVLERRANYRDPIVAKANEILGGDSATSPLKTGSQRVKNAAHLEALLKSVRMGMKLKFRFRPDSYGVGGLDSLIGMTQDHLVKFVGNDGIIAMAVSQSRDWERSENQSITIITMQAFSTNNADTARFMAEKLADSILTIEILPMVG